MVDFFKGFNPSGQGTMFGSNESSSSNNFYDFLEKKHGLTEEGMFDLTKSIGEKDKAPEFLKAFFEYRGEKPEQNKIDQMMGNSGFIMGLSLMQQAAGGKNLGAALMPAAETTQGFISNQELRNQRKQLIKDKETDRIIQVTKLSSDMETAEASRKSMEITNSLNLENLKTAQSETDLRNKTFKAIEENENLSADEKLREKNDYKNYAKVIDYSKFKADPDTLSQVEKKVNFKQSWFDSWIPYKGTSIDEEALQTQIVKDIAGLATEIATQKYDSGEYKTPAVTDQDINEAREKYIRDGKIKKPNFVERFFSSDSGTFDSSVVNLPGADKLEGPPDPFRAKGGEVNENQAYIVGEEGPEVFVPQQNGAIISNPKTAGGYTWEDAIIDNSEMLKKIKQSGGAEEAKKALKKFRPDLYI